MNSYTLKPSIGFLCVSFRPLSSPSVTIVTNVTQLSATPRSSWREKLDPFSDDEDELRDGQKAHRCWCYWCSSIPSKMRLAITVEPWPVHWSHFRCNNGIRRTFRNHGRSKPHRKQTSIWLIPNISPLQTILPVSQPAYQLSPLSELTSQSTLPLQILVLTRHTNTHLTPIRWALRRDFI